MRRSRSLSNIPMPCSKKDSKLRRPTSAVRAVPLVRSVSSVRTSSSDGQTPLAHKLAATPLGYRNGPDWSDQKYKTQKNVTPTYYAAYKRSGSASSLSKNLTPACSSRYKRSGSISSFGSRVSPREKKSMQKSINDKKWIAEQFSKVQSFIQTSGLFDPELAGLLRPPTINTVVEVFSVLFRQLIKTDPINSQNYADIALTTLRLFKYPGTLTLSTLKTCNTMHGWPHFISILSWLIEKVDIGAIDFASGEQLDDELKRTVNAQDKVMEFLNAQYLLYANGEGNGEEIEKKLFNDLWLTTTGTEYEAVQSIDEPLESFRIEVAKLETPLKEIIEENQIIRAHILEKLEVIKKFKENDNNREHDLEEELSRLRKLCTEYKEKMNILITSNEELAYIVKHQPYNINDRTEIVGKIEELKRAISRKEQKLTEYRLLKDELDLELWNMIREIEALVDSWNVSITKTLLSEMQELRLREKEFHKLEFIEEIREIRRKNDEIQKKFHDEFKNIEIKIEKLQTKRESFIKNKKSTDATRLKLDSLRSSIRGSKEENRSLLLEIDETEKKLNTNILTIENSDGGKVKVSETEIAELDERINNLTKDIDKAAKMGVSVLVEAHKMVLQNIQRADKAMQSVLKDITQKADESTNSTEETFNLLRLQEKKN